MASIAALSAHLWAPDLSVDSHSFAATTYLESGVGFHLMINAYWESLCFSLPAVPDGCRPWRRLIDTFQDSPSDFLDKRLRQNITPLTPFNLGRSC
jgi:glycogen operon protein